MRAPESGRRRCTVRWAAIAAFGGIILTTISMYASGSGRAPKEVSMATADFDEDGVPDLVSGYSSGGLGSIALQRGNEDAVRPNTPDARSAGPKATSTPLRSSPLAEIDRLALAADFIGAGDFDADGHADVVIAARAVAMRSSCCEAMGEVPSMLRNEFALPGT